MKQDQKQLYWEKHLQEWQVSQLSQRAYCEQHQLSIASFGYWRKRLKKAAPIEKKLIPVARNNVSVIRISLRDGIQLDIPSHALAESLPIILRMAQDTR